MSDPGGEAHPDEQAQAYRSLVETVSKGAVLFVGAGSSKPLGFPLWSGLLQDLAKAAADVDQVEVARFKGLDGLLQASAYKRILGDERYNELLKNTFGPKSPAHLACHETLVSIPFRHVLTTNYDGCLESAHTATFGELPHSFDADEWGKLAAFRLQQATSASKRIYVHLHGSASRPHAIVLTKEDYDGRYYQETRYSTFLRELLVGQRLVFLGFSLSDEDFEAVLRQVDATLQSAGPRHFVILPRPANPEDARIAATNRRMKHGVETVYYDDPAGDHSGLWEFVEGLKRDVAARVKTDSVVSIAALDYLIKEYISDPTSRQLAANRIPELARQFAVVAPVNAGSGATTTPIDAEIDAVFKLVAHGLPDEAIAEYTSIAERERDRLTAKQRYRIDANIGNALYTKGALKAASEAYLKAVAYYRESKEARAIEALGHFLAGDMEVARHLAEALCKSDPTYARGWSLWVRCHDKTESFELVEKAVPSSLLPEAEVALALSDLAGRCGNLEADIRHARAAMTAQPNWADALSAFASAVATSERRTAKPHVDRRLIPAHPALVEEGVQALTRAINEIGTKDPAGRLAGLYFNRSVVLRLLGRFPEAEADLRRAFEFDTVDPTIVLGFSIEAESASDVDRALAALARVRAAGGLTDQHLFAEILLRLRRARPEDIEGAWTQVISISERLETVEPTILRADVLRAAMKAASLRGQSGDAIDLISRVHAGAVQPVELQIILARAYLSAGNDREARKLAESAAAEALKSGSWFEQRELAVLCQELRLHQESFALWRRVVPEGDVGSDSVHLARAAYFAGEWRVALNVCDQVRTEGVLSRRHLEVEIEILANSREAPLAIARLDEWLAKFPADRHAILRRSVLALQNHQPDKAEFRESFLPTVDQVEHAGQGAALVFVVRRGPSPERAVDIAYQLYRRFPDEETAQQALVSCVFDPSATPIQLNRPSVVGAGTAVQVSRPEDPTRWVYIESGDKPSASRDEFPPTHEFALAMMGLKTGDKFQFQGHSYDILAIENRALRRVHEIMERYEETFPTGKFYRRFSAPSNPSADAPLEQKLGDVYLELKRQEDNRLLLESMYRENRLPIASFASLMGRTVFETVRYLASDRTIGIRADDGDGATWMPTVATISAAKELVIDGTILAGALVLDCLDDLRRISQRIVVPQAVVDEIRRVALDVGNPRPHGTMGLRGGKFFFYTPSPAEAAEEASRIERVLKFIGEHCEVVGGGAVLDLPKAVRESLDKAFDDTSIDAIAIARRRNAPLWTDDLVLQWGLSQLQVPITRVWTQAVLQQAQQEGRLGKERYRELLASMIECGYAFTRLTVDEMLSILKSAKWKVNRGTGAALVETVGRVARINLHNALLAAFLLRFIWTDCRDREVAKRIITAILESVGRAHVRLMVRRIFRFRAIEPVRLNDGLKIAAASGVSRSRAKPRQILVPFEPFKHPESRSLKRFIRSWLSRSGEFRPGISTHPHHRPHTTLTSNPAAPPQAQSPNTTSPRPR